MSLRRFLLWVVFDTKFYIPNWLLPWIVGAALGRRPRRVR